MVSTVLLTLSSRRLRSSAVYLSSRTMREMKTFSRAMSQRVCRAADTFALGAPAGTGACFSSSAAIFFWCLTSASMRVTVALTRDCTTSSVSSSSSKTTTSFTLRTPRLRSSPRRDDFANHDGRARNGLEHAHLAALNALGDFDFAFAGKQRNGAHFAQIHANGVVGFFKRARRQVELDVFALFQFEIFVAWQIWGVEQVDALGADGCDQIVQVVGRANLIRQDVVDIAVGEIALFLADVDQAVNIVFEFVVNRQISPALCAILRFGTGLRSDAGPVSAGA